MANWACTAAPLSGKLDYKQGSSDAYVQNFKTLLLQSPRCLHCHLYNWLEIATYSIFLYTIDGAVVRLIKLNLVCN